jgi:hypothetical protein
MDNLAREYANDAHFIFVYTRETHPDKHPTWPTFTSIEQKFEHARRCRDYHESPRTFLIDALDGDVHRAYSGCANMSWIIDHSGRVHFKANWTREQDLRWALENAIDIPAMKRDPSLRLKPYHIEATTYLKSGAPVGGTSAVPGDEDWERPVRPPR